MPVRNGLSRRQFLLGATAMGCSSAVSFPTLAKVEAPPEVSKIRIAEALVACQAPLHVAEDLLKAEGFGDLEFIPGSSDTGPNLVARGVADFTQWAVGANFLLLDRSDNLLILAGIHAGCQQLFAHKHIKAIRDLKGKRIAISAKNNDDHVFLSSILAYVGMNPGKDIEWVSGSSLQDSRTLFLQERADAFMAFEPEGYELRQKRIGHIILDTTTDRPWSQYYCCMFAGNRDFVRKYPIATKRVLRAMLKASDICAQDPDLAARLMSERGYEKRFEVGREIIRSLPYNRWREANPEDTIRFHALRLREVGLIKSTPEKLIAQGTDWRYLNELKREMKV